MTFFQSIFLGAVQGITEFLPISSSGHLVLFPQLLGWTSQPLVFDTVLHLGTALSLVVYFWQDLYVIIKAFISSVFSFRTKYKKYPEFARLGVYILVGSIPAGFIGFVFNDFFENNFRNVTSVIAFLVFGSVLMFIAERFSKESFDVLNSKKSFIIGLFQSLALFPGVSRSGATISAGMFSGLNREEAARFSFLLSVPIVIVATTFKLVESFSLLLSGPLLPVLTGFVASFLVGLFAINFLLGFLKKNSLYLFIIYRLFLVFVLVIFLTA